MAPPPKTTTVKTNSTANSICDDNHAPIKFDTIWDNYPSDEPCHDPQGKIPKEYENQCSMSVGYALEKSGVTFKSYKGARCPWGPKDGGMVTGAQDLANWLLKRPFCGCPEVEKYSGADVFTHIDGRTGIVFFSDYWERSPGQRTGDHIDLWKNWRIRSKLASSILRVQFHISIDGWFSDFRKAKQALFWHIK